MTGYMLERKKKETFYKSSTQLNSNALHMNPSSDTYRILATADLHLGALGDKAPAGESLLSPGEVWQNVVRQCITLKSDVLLIAGDLIDQEADFAEVSRMLDKSFSMLEEAGIDIVLISGNHDYDLLPFYLETRSFDHITLLGANGNWEAITIEKHGIRFGIAGRSFPEIDQQSDPLLGAEEILESAMHPLIAMLHCDTKNPESIFGYVEMEKLIDLPVDAWILGHLHEPIMLNIHPIILYPGNPGTQTYSGKSAGPVSIEFQNNCFSKPDWLTI
jgi:DNA repair protein SbcD/Mre11